MYRGPFFNKESWIFIKISYTTSFFRFFLLHGTSLLQTFSSRICFSVASLCPSPLLTSSTSTWHLDQIWWDIEFIKVSIIYSLISRIFSANWWEVLKLLLSFFLHSPFFWLLLTDTDSSFILNQCRFLQEWSDLLLINSVLIFIFLRPY